MTRARLGTALLGVVAGMALMGVIVWQAMPRMMLIQHESALGFDETVAALTEALAKKQDWKVLTVNDYQKSIEAGGFGEMKRIGSIAVCNPRYASRILREDGNKKVTAMMPIEVGIYEDRDGKVHVSELHVGLMGRMFGGTIAEVMGQAGRDLNDAIAQATRRPE